MRRKWRWPLALVIAVTVMPLVADVSLAQAEREGIVWQPCGAQKGGECATIPVPVDWADPHSATFDLAIGRLRAVDPGRRIGVLFINPGGPGVSGIDVFVMGGAIGVDSPLRQHFDIVTWDPRGVSRSRPVLCDKSLVDQTPTEYPATSDDFQRLVAFNARLGADCRAHTGRVFDQVDTLSTVLDMDAIRTALGERKLSYFGTSYGTQIGQQYAEMFPDRIRAMAIDSNMDHSITSAYDYLRTTTDDLEGAFKEFAMWCARTPGCALHGRDVIAVWDELHARAEDGKLIDPSNGTPVGAEALRGLLWGAMIHPSGRWFPLASRLAALAAGSGGDSTAAGTAVELTANSYQAIWCEDWRWDVRGIDDLKLIREQAEARAPHTKLSPFWTDITTCLGWPAAVNNPQHRLSIRGAPPILIVTARYDVSTPREWSDAVADQIANSVTLEYDGVAHGLYPQNGCIRSHVDAYLITLRTPARNTHCPAEYPTLQSPTEVSDWLPTDRSIHQGTRRISGLSWATVSPAPHATAR